MNLNNTLFLIIAIMLNILSLLQVPYIPIIYTFVIATMIVVFIYKYKEELTLSRILLFLLSCLGLSFYIYFRMHVSQMANLSIAKFGSNIMTSNGLNFSFGYGLTQILGGLLFKTFPVISGVISYIGSGIILLLIAFSNNILLTKILFILLGIMSVGINLNTNVCPNLYFKSDWFATLSIYGVSFCFYITSGILMSMTPFFSWFGLYSSLSAILITIGVLYFAISQITKPINETKVENKCENTCETKCDTETSAISSSINNDSLQNNNMDLQNNSISTLKIVYMCIFCAIVVIPYYAIQGGVLSVVSRDIIISGELSGLICLIIPMVEHLNDKLIMYVSTLIGIIGLILVLITKKVILLQIAIACLTVVAMSHNYPFIIVGKRMKNIGLVCSILNFGAMFIGCYGGQWLLQTFLSTYSLKTISMIFLPLFTSLLGLIYLM